MPGILIPHVRIEALGMDPAPWRAPTIARNGGRFKDKKLLAWQEFVRTCAQVACRGLGQILTPIALKATFYRRPPEGRRPGEPWDADIQYNAELGKFTRRGRPIPDVTNLLKGLEDTLQGVVFADDAQVVQSEARRLYGPEDGAVVEVFRYDEVADFYKAPDFAIGG
jgi:Holliday junction resolvase RusA-like endonuclease